MRYTFRVTNTIYSRINNAIRVFHVAKVINNNGIVIFIKRELNGIEVVENKMVFYTSYKSRGANVHIGNETYVRGIYWND